METGEQTVVFNDGEEKVMLKVCISDDGTQYRVYAPSGSSVPETAFCMAVVIKCMQRDGVIQNTDDVLELIKKYLDDPQYQEVEANETDEPSEPDDKNIKEVNANDSESV